MLRRIKHPKYGTGSKCHVDSQLRPTLLGHFGKIPNMLKGTGDEADHLEASPPLKQHAHLSRKHLH
jgi:hypothetical protein